MTLETLKIEFQAETAPLEARIGDLTRTLDGFSASLDLLSEAARPAGRLAAEAFAGGIASGAEAAEDAAGELARSARFDDSAALGAAASAGGQLAAGFAGGISGGAGAVYSAVRRMVNQTTGLIRSMLGIHSPSKVAEDFGGYFGEGFARGISGSLGAVESAGAAMADAAGASLGAALPREAREAAPVGAAAVGAAMENLNITIPLNVDGIKLGEASIRGINAVTRSAGRILLEI